MLSIKKLFVDMRTTFYVTKALKRREYDIANGITSIALLIARSKK